MTKFAFVSVALLAAICFEATLGVEFSIFHQKRDHYGMIRDSRNVEATFQQRFIVVDNHYKGPKPNFDSDEYLDLFNEQLFDDDFDFDNDTNTTTTEAPEPVITTEIKTTAPYVPVVTTDTTTELPTTTEPTTTYSPATDIPTIFLYTGGQGPIDEFYNKSGYVVELAKYYGAVAVFAEHRFYGKSLPFGSESFNESHLPYLTVDQVVADYMNLVYFLKYSYGMSDAKVITFGNFYAGSLASYMRFKYPEHISGTLASGAPVKMADDFQKRTLFWSAVTNIFKNVSDVGPDVVESVRTGWDYLNELQQYGPQGYASISRMMHTCQPVDSDNFEDLQKIVRTPFAQLSLSNYPFPYNGYQANVVAQAANIINDAKDEVDGLYKIALFYYKLDDGDCIDLEEIPSECADQTGCMPGLRGLAWDFQLCWEVLSEVGSNIGYSMFPNLEWTKEDLEAYCGDKFELPVNQRYQWFKINYWGSQVSSASNIIWTNGVLDPWYGTGIALNTTPYLTALGAMEGASQGLDLMTPVDGDGMAQYRNMEKELIGQIIHGTFPSS